MADTSFLDWPFFDDQHRALAASIRVAAPTLARAASSDDVDIATRAAVRALGAGGWLRHVVPQQFGGARPRLDVRTLCIMRESLAYASGLADFAFAMQGLGTGAITEYGTDDQRQLYLPPVVRGETVAAFAVSERDAGSDIAAMRATARSNGDGFILDGEKMWISNAGIANHYVIVCRYPEAGERGYAAFVVDADMHGLSISTRIDVNAPHVLGTLMLDDCRVPRSALIGEPGAGLKIALGTLDIFRSTVGAAALGFARRALDEALSWVTTRHVFGSRLADMQLTQAKIADMAVAVDAAALLVYRAAWARDTGAGRVTREAAMAKLYATDSAQHVIDEAVQLLGARGVMAGSTVEKLSREVRALRIYEGTSEIQKIIIAGQVVAGHEREAAAYGSDAATHGREAVHNRDAAAADG